jgi:hypothetical protein
MPADAGLINAVKARLKVLLSVDGKRGAERPAGSAVFPDVSVDVLIDGFDAG